MDKLISILLVDDDSSIRKLLESLLAKHGFSVFAAKDSREAEYLAQKNKIDLVILDLILPGEKDGIALCRSLRELGCPSVIMLSGISEDVERIISLEVGADYYLTKPFNSRVLLAHIHAALRRGRESKKYESKHSIAAEHHVYEFSGWKLNITARVLLSSDNKYIKLTSAEYSLLQTLLEHSQRVLSRDQLMSMTNINTDSFDRSVDILISRLRSKIEGNPKSGKLITTIRNGGYMLSSAVNKKIIDNENWLMLTTEAAVY